MNEYLHSIVIKSKSQGCHTDKEEESKPREHYDLDQTCSVLFSLEECVYQEKAGVLQLRKIR